MTSKSERYEKALVVRLGQTDLNRKSNYFVVVEVENHNASYLKATKRTDVAKNTYKPQFQQSVFQFTIAQISSVSSPFEANIIVVIKLFEVKLKEKLTGNAQPNDDAISCVGVAKLALNSYSYRSLLDGLSIDAKLNSPSQPSKSSSKKKKDKDISLSESEDTADMGVLTLHLQIQAKVTRFFLRVFLFIRALRQWRWITTAKFNLRRDLTPLRIKILFFVSQRLKNRNAMYFKLILTSFIFAL